MNTLITGSISSTVEAVLINILAAAIAAGLAMVAYIIVFTALDRLTKRTSGIIDNSLVRHAKKPARTIFVILGLLLALPSLTIADDIKVSIERLLSLALTAAVGWLAVNLTRVINDVVAARYNIGVVDNLTAREVHTRVRLLQRILAAIVIVITLCLILMAIPGIRQIGV
ncbi:MAG: hypothetical protein ACSLFL_06975, partial [Alphaproteobacteria bacterium]